MLITQCSCGNRLESPDKPTEIIASLKHCADSHPENFYSALQALADMYGKGWPTDDLVVSALLNI